MFSSTLRQHARAGLVSSRLSVSINSSSSAVLRARPSLNSSIPLSFARLLSTTNVLNLNAPSANVYMGSLPFSVTVDEIREAVEPFGEIERVHISTDQDGRPRGFAHVHFSSASDATTFVNSYSEGQPLVFQDRPAVLDFTPDRPSRQSQESFSNRANSPSETLYIGNLAFATDDVDLRETFEAFGPIKRIAIARDGQGNPRGFAHIQFNSVDAASAAVNAQPMSILQRQVRMDFAPPKNDVVSEPNHKLYFYDYHGDEAGIRAAFQDLERDVVAIHFLRNRETNEITGAGFIDFKSIPDATRALEGVSGSTTPSGATLNLSYAKASRGPRTGGRDGGDFRGGNRGGSQRGGGGGGGYGGRSQGNGGRQSSYGGDW